MFIDVVVALFLFLLILVILVVFIVVVVIFIVVVILFKREGSCFAITQGSWQVRILFIFFHRLRLVRLHLLFHRRFTRLIPCILPILRRLVVLLLLAAGFAGFCSQDLTCQGFLGLRNFQPFVLLRLDHRFW